VDADRLYSQISITVTFILVTLSLSPV